MKTDLYKQLFPQPSDEDIVRCLIPRLHKFYLNKSGNRFGIYYNRYNMHRQHEISVLAKVLDWTFKRTDMVYIYLMHSTNQFFIANKKDGLPADDNGNTYIGEYNCHANNKCYALRSIMKPFEDSRNLNAESYVKKMMKRKESVSQVSSCVCRSNGLGHDVDLDLLIYVCPEYNEMKTAELLRRTEKEIETACHINELEEEMINEFS